MTLKALLCKKKQTKSVEPLQRTAFPVPVGTKPVKTGEKLPLEKREQESWEGGLLSLLASPVKIGRISVTCVLTKNKKGVKLWMERPLCFRSLIAAVNQEASVLPKNSK